MRNWKIGNRASTFICLIESFIISFILSPVPVPVPPRAMASISRIVLDGRRREMVIRRKMQIRTHPRKAVIATNDLDESSSQKDASWTVNVTDRARTSES